MGIPFSRESDEVKEAKKNFVQNKKKSLKRPTERKTKRNVFDGRSWKEALQGSKNCSMPKLRLSGSEWELCEAPTD